MSPEQHKVPADVISRLDLSSGQQRQCDNGEPRHDDERRHRAGGYLGLLLERIAAHFSRERVRGVQALAEDYPITRIKKTVPVLRVGAVRKDGDLSGPNTVATPRLPFQPLGDCVAAASRAPRGRRGEKPRLAAREIANQYRGSVSWDCRRRELCVADSQFLETGWWANELGAGAEAASSSHP